MLVSSMLQFVQSYTINNFHVVSDAHETHVQEISRISIQSVTDKDDIRQADEIDELKQIESHLESMRIDDAIELDYSHTQFPIPS